MIAALWIIGAIAYISLGLVIVMIFDNQPSPASIIPLMLWPVIILASAIVYILALTPARPTKPISRQ